MKNLLLILFLFTTNISSAICTLIVDNGDWSSSSSWSCGYVPASSGDTMRIPASMTVVVNINSPTYVNMRIEVYGTMQFENGQKINMDSDGVVDIYEGGMLTGGNSGSKLNIGAIAWWSGNDPPLTGPTSVSNSGFGSLPIELISFDALEYNESICLVWIVASQINNNYFTIYESYDGYEWEDLVDISGAGNSITIMEYKWYDDYITYGTVYYKLRQTDFDGKYEEFQIIAIDILDPDRYVELINTFNLLGVEVDDTYKGLVINVYSDGHTTKKLQ